MKEVLERIEQRKKEFASLPLLNYLVDESIDPLERVAWAPCFAPFAMMFKDINSYALRKEPTDNPIQEMINRHSYEDGRHWRWYLHDIEKLGINNDLKLSFSETLNFLWGEQTEKTRQLCYNLFALCVLEEDLIVKLAVIECIEATGNTALPYFVKLGEQLEEVTQQKCLYFSKYHLDVETGHIQSGMSSEETENLLHNMQMTEEQKAKALKAVDIVFDSFFECFDEMGKSKRMIFNEQQEEKTDSLNQNKSLASTAI
ncbi:MAG: hypothetical protein SWZ49_08085 [Cyanobacteriota bacterium]|nr:hypothetical protein [Cyanobacteriota bacterium]